MTSVNLFSDGAARGNPEGPAGYGTILQVIDGSGRKHEKELSAGFKKSTNNRMELTAVIEGLKSLKRRCTVEICTDSQYVKNGMESWIHGWKKNGWKTASKKPVKNDDLWKELDSLVQQHDVRWTWVKGHAGHPENEKADELANRGAAKFL